jgi:hypothetical protein
VIIGKKEITENTDFTSDLNKLADFEEKKENKKNECISRVF